MADSPDVARTVVAFQVAVARLSMRATREAAKWWAALNDEAAAKTLARNGVPNWDEGARLGVAFYRLLRALETGSTVSDPLAKTSEGQTTIGSLVQAFETAAGAPIQGFSTYRNRPVKVDNLSGVVISDWRAADAEAARLQVADRMELVKKREGREESDQTYAAGVAQKQAANGARSMQRAMGSADPKCRGWVRVSTTGTPCSFCAMLLSRGFVLKSSIYSSKATATGPVQESTGVHEYHPHCKCVAKPIFSGSDFSSGLYSTNRRFAAEYTEHAKNQPLSVWRSYYWKTYGR